MWESVREITIVWLVMPVAVDDDDDCYIDFQFEVLAFLMHKCKYTMRIK